MESVLTVSNFYLISLTAALGIILMVIGYRKQHRHLPPGPFGLPFVGYYPFLSAEPYRDFAELAKRYGNVFSYRTVGGKLVIVVNGIEAIKDMLVKRYGEFIGRPKESNLIDWISDGIGITQEEGLPWKIHRQFFIQSLKKLGLNNQETELKIHEEIETMIKDVRRANDHPIDFSLNLAYILNSVISPFLFSKKYEKDTKEFRKIADGAQQLVAQFVDRQYLMVGSIYKYIVMNFFSSTQEIRKAKQSLKNIVKEIVDDHVKNFDPNSINDYIDSYLHEAYKLEKNDATKNHSFTKNRLYGIALNMLMEGTETAAGTLCGMLSEISRHEKEQKLVQEELDSVIGQDRLPSWMDRLKLPYLRAFIQETKRITAPFNISTYYSNFEETTLQGYQIPKRSLIIANLWTINNDPLIFPEPSKFDPERFLRENDSKVKNPEPCIYGVGKRTCIVESLVDKEIFLIIGSILQNFTLYPAEKEDLIKAVPRNESIKST